MDTTQQLLETLAQLHEAHPSWRFGQLVANISLLAKGPVNSAVCDAEDEEFLKAAQDHLTQLQARRLEQVAV